MCKSTKSKRDREGLRSRVQRQRERVRTREGWLVVARQVCVYVCVSERTHMLRQGWGLKGLTISCLRFFWCNQHMQDMLLGEKRCFKCGDGEETHCVYSWCPLLLLSQGSFLVGMVGLWLLPWGNKANTESCFCSNRVRHCGLVGGVWMEAIGRAFVCAICSYMCRRDSVCVCACVGVCACSRYWYSMSSRSWSQCL